MSDAQNYPNKSHFEFPYYFTDNDIPSRPLRGIDFGDIPVPPPKDHLYDLSIYYDSLTGDDFIDCRCSRWDVQNYSVIVEAWIKKTDMKTLLDNTVVGAVGELYNILGRPRYYDKTWSGDNTLKISPTSNPSKMKTSKLKRMRKDTLIFPKNISYSNVDGGSGWVPVKIEGYVSGQGSL